MVTDSMAKAIIGGERHKQKKLVEKLEQELRKAKQKLKAYDKACNKLEGKK